MTATLYLHDRATGLVFTALAVTVDNRGRLTDERLAAAVRDGGWGCSIVRDMGVGARRYNDARGGFGHGGRPRPIEG